MKRKLILLIPLILLVFDVSFAQINENYKNFKVAVYARSYEVRQMDDLKWLEPIWTDFRLKQMTEAAQSLVILPAKAVNSRVKIVIKYPNWYEHFQGLGFNLETEPPIFDGIYTGTETRNPDGPGQHLQQYLGYLAFRYFENIKPGGNGGGWVDTGGMTYMDRYAEQLWLTLFAKAPEITLFDFRQMQRIIRPADRAVWQDQKPSFDYDEMMKPYMLKNGKQVTPTTVARTDGITFEKVDRFLGQLGKPVGIQSYKPYHSTGEDFLHNYFGMIGLPMDLRPEFPSEPKMILLTESAKFDPETVKKIKERLIAGKNVAITSGLLRALQGKGIEDIIELELTDRKALVTEFSAGWISKGNKSLKEILIPQIQYLTNDSWTDVEALGGPVGWPVLHQGRYGNASLFVLTIPDSFGDLYALPDGVLNRIRDVLTPDLNFRIEAPSQVSLFIYDNNTFIVESFLPGETKIKIAAGEGINKLIDLETNEQISGSGKSSGMIWGREREEKSLFDLTLKPHSYRVFKAE